MIKIAVCIPPMIAQCYDSKILSYPCPKFRDCARDLFKIYQYIKFYLQKKCKTPRRIEKFKKLEEEFLKLYEQAVKEEKLKEETEHHTQRFFYCFKRIDQKDESIFRRLKYRSLFNGRPVKNEWND